jgi:hypothetical protein
MGRSKALAAQAAAAMALDQSEATLREMSTVAEPDAEAPISPMKDARMEAIDSRSWDDDDDEGSFIFDETDEEGT